MIAGIILARGGSKGIPGKNVLLIAGKPLIAWSIEQSLNSPLIDSTWVSSDSDKILEIAQSFGANPIKRPPEIAGDKSSSEEAWLHAIDYIHSTHNIGLDAIVGLQPTSPIRESSDLTCAIETFKEKGYDSMFSISKPLEGFRWQMTDGLLQSVDYDYTQRKMRQNIQETYYENGSFYIFKPSIIQKYNNRLGGKIGMFKMDFYKTFQIDEPEDIRMCEIIMLEYLLANK